jgi:hypothetical protein
MYIENLTPKKYGFLQDLDSDLMERRLKCERLNAEMTKNSCSMRTSLICSLNFFFFFWTRYPAHIVR